MNLKRLYTFIRSLKNSFLNRTPKEKWCFVRYFGNFMLLFTGVQFLDPNFKISWSCFVPAIATVDYVLCFGYTVWYYIGRDSIKAILMVPTIGLFIPSVLLYYLSVMPTPQKTYLSLVWFAGDKIYTDIFEDSNPDYIRLCHQNAIKLLKSTLNTVVILVTCSIIYAFFPMYAFFVQHDLQMPTTILVPFTMLESNFGLFVNVLNQAFFTVIGYFGSFSAEIINCMLRNTVWALMKIICQSMDEFSAYLKSQTSKNSDVGFRFRHMIVQMQDYDCFVNTLSKFFYWRFFIQPYLMMIAVSISFFFYLFFNWISGIGFALFLYSQLFILCGIGNDVDFANERMLTQFQEIPWYLMSQNHQLIYGHLLVRLQNAVTIRMGPLARINMALFSDMTKKMYSFLMMLIRFVE